VWTPFEHCPVWVDDEEFNLDYHFRHTSLPRPGTEQQLKRLAARIMERPLDESKPLWENWVVEGLEGDRFAAISKTHCCMIEGASGADLTQVIMSTDSGYEPPEAPRYLPRAVPSPLELLRDALWWRIGRPFRSLRGIQRFRYELENFCAELNHRVRSVRHVLAPESTSGAFETPINGDVGPHRIVEWLTMPLSDFTALRKALDCTVNDVVLATVTGAFRHFFEQRGMRPEEIGFRITIPVRVDRQEDPGNLADQLSGWTLELPIGEEDPARQLELIREQSRELKEPREVLGVMTTMSLTELTPGWVALAARVTEGTNNTYMINVPGPQKPLFLLGAEMLQLYLQAPLMQNLGLVIDLMSYNGQACWGFNADPGIVPDLAAFVRSVDRSFRRLARAAPAKLALAKPLDQRPGARSKSKRSRTKSNGDGSHASSP
jgi:WS/DGAT/MGAT family acyltransferase